MATTTVPLSVVGLVAKMFEELPEPLPPQVARVLLRLDFPKVDHKRMAVLAKKSNAGTLTAIEQKELDSYLTAGNLLVVLQSIARTALNKNRHRR